MAWDYLNKTTLTDDVAQTTDLLSSLASSYQEPSAYSQFDEIGEDDLIEMADESEPQQEELSNEIEGDSHSFENEELDDTDLQLMGYLFGEKDTSAAADSGFANASTVYSTDRETGDRIDLSWLRKKSNNVNIDGLNSNLSKYLMTLPEHIREELVATSGNDQDHTLNSKHYHNNAIDLRYNEKAYKYMLNDPLAKKYGIKLLNPNHGTAPHLHLETKKFGGMLNATTPYQLTRGLNNPQFDSAKLNLTGVNTIRGLDNYKPVAVTDGNKYAILRGPQDTIQLKGNVYEKRM